jgi:hypothetical protein
MMAKLGYKPGTTLGKAEDARAEPIGISIKEGKGGIGHDNERKRKIREEFEEAAKRVQVDQGDYRDRIRQEREERRLAGQVLGVQKVAERLDTEADEEATNRPLKSINVLWRGLMRDRLEKEAERRMRADMQQSRIRLPTYTDPDEEEEDKQAYEKKATNNDFVEEDLFTEDTELEEFQALSAPEKLDKVVRYLRDTYHYCFWCKFRYDDAEMEDCPGLTEEDHE